MSKRCLVTAALVGALCSCAPERIEPLSSSSAPIVDGSPSHNRSVVFLYNLAGAACTATIVAPRAVLTAKHCIQGGSSSAAPASQFVVYVGDSPYRPIRQYRVAEVRPAPGCWDLCGDASDVAMLILASPAVEEPVPISFEPPAGITGQTITAIGYGQTPAGSSGTQLSTSKRVTGVRGGLVFVEPAVCSGDSGGPVIGPEGMIWGVASFIYSPDGRSRPECGTAPGAYNGISHLRDFIVAAIEDSGSCVPDGEEVCNGADDDCDDEVDEVCTPPGEACTADDECVGSLCADTSAGRICSQACDPLRPGLGCPPGMYCDGSGGCEGLCVPGDSTESALGYGADCTSDIECASLFCADPGDGRQRCLDPCRGDAGMCLAGEACAATPGSCGGCVPADIVIGARGLGEPCASDEECGGSAASCFDDGGIEYCTRPCEDDEACGEGFHCRMGAHVCVRGPRGSVGSGCVENADCADGGLCAARGDVRWCTRACSDDCPEGFECVDAGGARVCSPSAGLVGERCEEAADCLSGLCVDTGSGTVCTRRCGPDSHCGTGLECVRTGDGRDAVCVPPPSRGSDDGGGCSVGEGPGRAGGVAWLLLVLGAVATMLRRKP